MANRRNPTVEELRQLLSYDPDTGLFTWRRRPSGTPQWNGRYAGKRAFATVGTHGYLRGSIFDRPRDAHRVAFAIHNGRWPDGEVDHINGNRQDNRAENLREVTSSENARNMRRSSANRSGQTGVHFYRQTRRWQAKIMHGGRQIHLGFFLDKDEAISARKEAEARYGYHENHGKPVREERGPQEARS